MNSRPAHDSLRKPWGQRLSQPALIRNGIFRILVIATSVLAACGLGYYLVDPAIESISEGLWLAFTTAATVGYGDVVPSTMASRVFSVIVVIVGFAVLSLVTASISALLVGKQERKIEHEILSDLHHQVRMLRHEIAELKTAHGLPSRQQKAPGPHDQGA
jgi:voltage-gated potassium channel